MTTIASTNSYYPSLYANFSKNGSNKNASGGSDYAGPRQSPPGGLTGGDTVFGAKLAGALWSMESQGVEIDQEAGDTWLGEPPTTTAEDEFLELSKKTFAERIRDQYLKEHNLTEDDLKAMSPEDREAIETEIRKAILEAMGVNGKTEETAMGMGAANPAAQASGDVAQQNAKDDPLLSME